MLMGKKLGAILKTTRKRAGLTQFALVNKIKQEHGLHVRQSRISEYECGRKEPTRRELECILLSLGHKPRGQDV
jgi:transcriptional regulator with XRE-family HTH domain